MNQTHQNPEADKVQNLNQPELQQNAAPQIENNKLEGQGFEAGNNQNLPGGNNLEADPGPNPDGDNVVYIDRINRLAEYCATNGDYQ